MMNYSDAREFAAGLKSRGIVPGLTSITTLCSLLGDPQNDIKTIHIAGTNGKGSVGAFLENILMAAGFKTARFSSPAVEKYEEMFTVNSVPIDGDVYSHAMDDVRAAAEKAGSMGINPTEFEAETAAAFLMFKEIKADYAIIECGMGGRLDSTNVIKSPQLCIITSVGLDHTAFLGDSIEKIAAEKAGIIKENVPAVIAECAEDVKEVIEKYAADKNAPLYFVNPAENIRYLKDKTVFDSENMKDVAIHLLGTYQPKNASAAIKAAQPLGISEKDIRNGLLNTRWGYRYERYGRFILDGAHNPAAARELVSSIKKYNDTPAVFICGIFKDKDYRNIARITAPFAEYVYTLKPPTDRGLDASVLSGQFAQCGVKSQPCADLEEAVLSAMRHKGNIIIFGSLSFLAEAKKTIINTEGNNINAAM